VAVAARRMGRSPERPRSGRRPGMFLVPSTAWAVAVEAVAVRCVPDPALCERNGEALHNQPVAGLYSEMGGCA
jgi:hypothetical protein